MPKLTAPLTKAIRTLEGWLVAATNAALLVGASVDPHSLPPKAAGIIAAANTGLLVASRTLLKLFAAQSTLGVGQPIPISYKASNVVSDAEHVGEQVARAAPVVVKEAEAIVADVHAPTSAQVERQAPPAAGSSDPIPAVLQPGETVVAAPPADPPPPAA